MRVKQVKSADDSRSVRVGAKVERDKENADYTIRDHISSKPFGFVSTVYDTAPTFEGTSSEHREYREEQKADPNQ
jgi:hypothetical protein